MKTQNRPQGESCVSSGVERSVPFVGCAESKLQSHTVLLNLKFFLLMQVFAWMVSRLLISGIWLLKYYILHQINIVFRETCVEIHNLENVPTQERRNTPTRWKILAGQMLITSPQTQNVLALVSCFIFFEDNEAVVKMIIKGRSPTMRHVRGVVLDWLFDRINLDPKIQIRYVDTKKQLSDILTKGILTREEWNHLLRLFNIVNISMFSSGHFSPVSYPQTMSKRLKQEAQPGEDERVRSQNRRGI